MKRKLLSYFWIPAFAGMTMLACGGGSPSATSASPSDSQNTSNNLPPPLNTPDLKITLDPNALRWEPMLRSPESTGEIAVMFEESAHVRLSADTHVILSAAKDLDISILNQFLTLHPEVEVRMGLPDLDPAELDMRIAEIREEGTPITDWGSFFIFTAVDPDTALELLSIIHQSNYTWFTHPVPRHTPTGIQIPNLGGNGLSQDYLKDFASTGGINVKAAWDAGLNGASIVVRDLESNWNITHKDLPLNDKSFATKDSSANTNEAATNHGTAVAGIVVGKDNGTGITGIAPNAVFHLDQEGGYSTGADVLSLLIKNQITYADGTPTPSIKPGDIYLIETESSNPNTEAPCVAKTASDPSTGCVPLETWMSTFLFYKDLVNAAGLVIVEGGGNGGVHLDTAGPFNSCVGNPNKSGCIVDFTKDSTGAIMVGASIGASLGVDPNKVVQKAPWTNCGKRIDVFSWGGGVVTTGYGDHPISVKSDKNQWYTQTFAGTSSASAIIAGSAALLQQYAQDLYKLKIKTTEFAYLNSVQMRDVLVKSGNPSKTFVPDAKYYNGLQDPNPGCNIGAQPDLAKAMQIIKDGFDGKPGGVPATVKFKDTKTYCPKPTLDNPNPKKASWCEPDGPQQSQIGKAMDLDGDKRGDLISFSRDRKWYVDFSKSGNTQFILVGEAKPKAEGVPDDHFGQWEVILDLNQDKQNPIPKDAMLFPVVVDYNTDGKADLGLYDSLSGKWYIKYTDSKVLNPSGKVNGVAPWPGWDLVLDYSQNKLHWKPYSRPVVADYDGQDDDPLTFNHYMDLGLQTPDGWWLIDLGGPDKVNYGAFDEAIQYLSADELKEAPAWAWLPVINLEGYPEKGGGWGFLSLKSPDTFTSRPENKIYAWSKDNKVLEFYALGAATFDSNASMMTVGHFTSKTSYAIGQKRNISNAGFWVLAPAGFDWEKIINPPPYINFLDIHCRPAPADYDGDGYDDRAVQCGDTWRIDYSGAIFNKNYSQSEKVMLDGKLQDKWQQYRYLKMDPVKDPLPGYVYPGGVSFKETKEIFSTVNYFCLINKSKIGECSFEKMAPQPMGPYFPQCVDQVRQAYPADACTNPTKSSQCESFRMQASQCAWE